MTSGTKYNMAENIEEYVVRYFVFMEGWEGVACRKKKYER
jgi:hypothetical protein